MILPGEFKVGPQQGLPVSLGGASPRSSGKFKPSPAQMVKMLPEQEDGLIYRAARGLDYLGRGIRGKVAGESWEPYGEDLTVGGPNTGDISGWDLMQKWGMNDVYDSETNTFRKQPLGEKYGQYSGWYDGLVHPNAGNWSGAVIDAVGSVFPWDTGFLKNWVKPANKTLQHFNPINWDPIDYLALGTEIALDPLTYAGGIGIFSKAMKMISKSGKLKNSAINLGTHAKILRARAARAGAGTATARTLMKEADKARAESLAQGQQAIRYDRGVERLGKASLLHKNRFDPGLAASGHYKGTHSWVNPSVEDMLRGHTEVVPGKGLRPTRRVMRPGQPTPVLEDYASHSMTQHLFNVAKERALSEGLKKGGKRSVTAGGLARGVKAGLIDEPLSLFKNRMQHEWDVLKGYASGELDRTYHVMGFNLPNMGETGTTNITRGLAKLMRKGLIPLRYVHAATAKTIDEALINFLRGKGVVPENVLDNAMREGFAMDEIVTLLGKEATPEVNLIVNSLTEGLQGVVEKGAGKSLGWSVPKAMEHILMRALRVPFAVVPEVVNSTLLGIPKWFYRRTLKPGATRSHKLAAAREVFKQATGMGIVGSKLMYSDLEKNLIRTIDPETLKDVYTSDEISMLQKGKMNINPSEGRSLEEMLEVVEMTNLLEATPSRVFDATSGADFSMIRRDFDTDAWQIKYDKAVKHRDILHGDIDADPEKLVKAQEKVNKLWNDRDSWEKSSLVDAFLEAGLRPVQRNYSSIDGAGEYRLGDADKKVYAYIEDGRPIGIDADTGEIIFQERTARETHQELFPWGGKAQQKEFKTDDELWEYVETPAPIKQEMVWGKNDEGFDEAIPLWQAEVGKEVWEESHMLGPGNKTVTKQLVMHGENEMKLPVLKKRAIKSEFPWADPTIRKVNTPQQKKQMAKIQKEKQGHIINSILNWVRNNRLNEGTGYLKEMQEPGDVIVKGEDPVRTQLAEDIGGWQKLSARDGWREFKEKNPEGAQLLRRLYFTPMFHDPKTRKFGLILRDTLSKLARSEMTIGLREFYDPDNLKYRVDQDFFGPDHPLTIAYKQHAKWGEGAHPGEVRMPDGEWLPIPKPIIRHDPDTPFGGQPAANLWNEEELLSFSRKMGLIDDKSLMPVDNWVAGVIEYFPRILSRVAREFFDKYPDLFEQWTNKMNKLMKEPFISGRFGNVRHIHEMATEEVGMVDVMEKFGAATEMFFREIVEEGVGSPYGTYKGTPLPKEIIENKLFEDDPIKAIATRHLMSQTAQAEAMYMQGVLHNFARLSIWDEGDKLPLPPAFQGINAETMVQSNAPLHNWQPNDGPMLSDSEAGSAYYPQNLTDEMLENRVGQAESYQKRVEETFEEPHGAFMRGKKARTEVSHEDATISTEHGAVDFDSQGQPYPFVLGMDEAQTALYREKEAAYRAMSDAERERVMADSFAQRFGDDTATSPEIAESTTMFRPEGEGVVQGEFKFMNPENYYDPNTKNFPAGKSEGGHVASDFFSVWDRYFSKFDTLPKEEADRIADIGWPQGAKVENKVIPSVEDFAGKSEWHKIFWDNLNRSPVVSQGVVGQPALGLFRSLLMDFDTRSIKHLAMGDHSVRWKLTGAEAKHYGQVSFIKDTSESAMQKKYEQLADQVMGEGKIQQPHPTLAEIGVRADLKETPIAAQVELLMHEINHVFWHRQTKDHALMRKVFTRTMQNYIQKHGSIKSLLRDYMQITRKNATVSYEGPEFDQMLDQYAREAANNPEEMFAVLSTMAQMRRRLPAGLADDPAVAWGLASVWKKISQSMKNVVQSLNNKVRWFFPSELKNKAGPYQVNRETRKLTKEWKRLRRKLEILEVDAARRNVMSTAKKKDPFYSRSELDSISETHQQMRDIESQLRLHADYEYDIQSRAKSGERVKLDDNRLFSGLDVDGQYMVKFIDSVTDWWAGMEGAVDDLQEAIFSRRQKTFFPEDYDKQGKILGTKAGIALVRKFEDLSKNSQEDLWASIRDLEDSRHLLSVERNSYTFPGDSDAVVGRMLREMDETLEKLRGRVNNFEELSRTVPELADDDSPLLQAFNEGLAYERSTPYVTNQKFVSEWYNRSREITQKYPDVAQWSYYSSDYGNEPFVMSAAQGGKVNWNTLEEVPLGEVRKVPERTVTTEVEVPQKWVHERDELREKGGKVKKIRLGKKVGPRFKTVERVIPAHEIPAEPMKPAEWYRRNKVLPPGFKDSIDALIHWKTEFDNGQHIADLELKSTMKEQVEGYNKLIEEHWANTTLPDRVGNSASPAGARGVKVSKEGVDSTYGRGAKNPIKILKNMLEYLPSNNAYRDWSREYKAALLEYYPDGKIPVSRVQGYYKGGEHEKIPGLRATAAGIKPDQELWAASWDPDWMIRRDRRGLSGNNFTVGDSHLRGMVDIDDIKFVGRDPIDASGAFEYSEISITSKGLREMHEHNLKEMEGYKPLVRWDGRSMMDGLMEDFKHLVQDENLARFLDRTPKGPIQDPRHRWNFPSPRWDEIEETYQYVGGKTYVKEAQGLALIYEIVNGTTIDDFPFESVKKRPKALPTDRVEAITYVQREYFSEEGREALLQLNKDLDENVISGITGHFYEMQPGYMHYGSLIPFIQEMQYRYALVDALRPDAPPSKYGGDTVKKVLSALEGDEYSANFGDLSGLKDENSAIRAAFPDGTPITPYGLLSKTPFGHALQEARQALGENADKWDDVVEFLTSSNAPDGRLHSAFRHYAPNGDVSLTISVDSVDVDYLDWYMRADIVHDRAQSHGGRGMAALRQAYPKHAYDGTPPTNLGTDTFAGSRDIRGWYLNMMEMLFGDNTIGRGIMTDKGFRRAKENPADFLDEVMPNRTKVSSHEVDWDLLPDNFWGLYDWLRHHKPAGREIQPLNLWLQNEMATANGLFFYPHIMSHQDDLARNLMGDGNKAIKMDSRVTEGSPSVVDSQDFKFSMLPDDVKMAKLDDYFWAQGINPTWVKAFVWSRYSDPVWKVMGDQLVPKTRYTTDAFGRTVPVRDYDMHHKSGGMDLNNNLTSNVTPEDVIRTEAQLSDHDMLWQSIMHWVDSSRSLLRTFQKDQSKTAPIGLRRFAGDEYAIKNRFEHGGMQGTRVDMSTSHPRLEEILGEGGDEIEIRNFNVERSSKESGVFIDPYASRALPSPFVGRFQTSAGKFRDAFEVDPITGSTRFQDVLEEEAARLRYEMDDLHRALYRGTETELELGPIDEAIAKTIKKLREEASDKPFPVKVINTGNSGFDVTVLDVTEEYRVPTGGFADDGYKIQGEAGTSNPALIKQGLREVKSARHSMDPLDPKRELSSREQALLSNIRAAEGTIMFTGPLGKSVGGGAKLPKAATLPHNFPYRSPENARPEVYEGAKNTYDAIIKGLRTGTTRAKRYKVGNVYRSNSDFAQSSDHDLLLKITSETGTLGAVAKKMQKKYEDVWASGHNKPFVRATGWVKESHVRKHPHVQFVFGDNLSDWGKHTGKEGKGGQAVIRHENNAVGIPTKKAPNKNPSSYWTMDEIDKAEEAIDRAFAQLDPSRPVVWPKDGIGTGRADPESIGDKRNLEMSSLKAAHKRLQRYIAKKVTAFKNLQKKHHRRPRTDFEWFRFSGTAEIWSRREGWSIDYLQNNWSKFSKRRQYTFENLGFYKDAVSSTGTPVDLSEYNWVKGVAGGKFSRGDVLEINIDGPMADNVKLIEDFIKGKGTINTYGMGGNTLNDIPDGLGKLWDIWSEVMSKHSKNSNKQSTLLKRISDLQKSSLGMTSSPSFKETLRQYYVHLSSEDMVPEVRKKWGKKKIEAWKILDKNLFREHQFDEYGVLPDIPTWTPEQEVLAMKHFAKYNPDNTMSPISISGRERPDLLLSPEQFVSGVDAPIPGVKPPKFVSRSPGDYWVPDFSEAKKMARTVLPNKTPGEINEMIQFLGPYDFQRYIGQAMDRHFSPKMRVNIPAGGRQARMTELLDPDTLEPTGRSMGDRPMDAGAELDVSVINASPEDMFDKGMEHIRPPRHLSPMDAEAWYASAHGFATKRDMPVEHVMRELPDSSMARWEPELNKYRRNLESQLGRKFTPGEWEGTKMDFLFRMREHRVNPAETELFSPGGWEGPDSLYGRLPWLRAQGEASGKAPYRYIPKRLKLLDRLESNDLNKPRGLFRNSDWYDPDPDKHAALMELQKERQAHWRSLAKDTLWDEYPGYQDPMTNLTEAEKREIQPPVHGGWDQHGLTLDDYVSGPKRTDPKAKPFEKYKLGDLGFGFSGLGRREGGYAIPQYSKSGKKKWIPHGSLANWEFMDLKKAWSTDPDSPNWVGLITPMREHYDKVEEGQQRFADSVFLTGLREHPEIAGKFEAIREDVLFTHPVDRLRRMPPVFGPPTNGGVSEGFFQTVDVEGKVDGVSKIISGMQSGVDMDALVWAKDNGFDTGGTTPPGFMQWDAGRKKTIARPDLAREYGLKEGAEDETLYEKRTLANVEDSDGTVLYYPTKAEGVSGEIRIQKGTALTRTYAKMRGRPYIENPSSEQLARWVEKHNIRTLNVAGPREGVSPDTIAKSLDGLGDVRHKAPRTKVIWNGGSGIAGPEDIIVLDNWLRDNINKLPKKFYEFMRFEMVNHPMYHELVRQYKWMPTKRKPKPYRAPFQQGSHLPEPEWKNLEEKLADFNPPIENLSRPMNWKTWKTIEGDAFVSSITAEEARRMDEEDLFIYLGLDRYKGKGKTFEEQHMAKRKKVKRKGKTVQIPDKGKFGLATSYEVADKQRDLIREAQETWQPYTFDEAGNKTLTPAGEDEAYQKYIALWKKAEGLDPTGRGRIYSGPIPGALSSQEQELVDKLNSRATQKGHIMNEWSGVDDETRIQILQQWGDEILHWAERQNLEPLDIALMAKEGKLEPRDLFNPQAVEEGGKITPAKSDIQKGVDPDERLEEFGSDWRGAPEDHKKQLLNQLLEDPAADYGMSVEDFSAEALRSLKNKLHDAWMNKGKHTGYGMEIPDDVAKNLLARIRSGDLKPVGHDTFEEIVILKDKDGNDYQFAMGKPDMGEAIGVSSKSLDSLTQRGSSYENRMAQDGFVHPGADSIAHKGKPSDVAATEEAYAQRAEAERLANQQSDLSTQAARDEAEGKVRERWSKDISPDGRFNREYFEGKGAYERFGTRRIGSWVKKSPKEMQEEAVVGMQPVSKEGMPPHRMTIDQNEQYIQGLGRKIARFKQKHSIAPSHGDYGQPPNIRGVNELGGMHRELAKRLQDYVDPSTGLTDPAERLAMRGVLTSYDERVWPSVDEIREIYGVTDVRYHTPVVDYLEGQRKRFSGDAGEQDETFNRVLGWDPAAVGADAPRSELRRARGHSMLGYSIGPDNIRGAKIPKYDDSGYKRKLNAQVFENGEAVYDGRRESLINGTGQHVVRMYETVQKMKEQGLRTFMHPETGQLVPIGNNLEDTKEIFKKYGLLDYGIPIDVHREMVETPHTMVMGRWPKKIFNAVQMSTGFFKASMIAFFPSYYVRNLFSDSVLSLMSDSLDLKVRQDAIAMAFGADVPLSKKIKHQARLRRLGKDGVVTAGDMARAAEAGGAFQGTKTGQMVDQIQRETNNTEFSKAVTRLHKDQKNLGAIGKLNSKIKPSLWQKLTGFRWVMRHAIPTEYRAAFDQMSMRQIMQLGERYTRSAHILSRINKGELIGEAIQHARVHLLDYGDLTNFEKVYMQNTILFYSWTRKIMPLLYQNFMEHPGRMAAIMRGYVQPGEKRDKPLPEFLRTTAAIPFGGGFIYSSGIPIEELSKLDFTTPTHAVPQNMSELMESLTKVASRFASQMHPIPKFITEAVTGKDMFYDKELAEMDKVGPEWWLLDKMPFMQVDTQYLPGGAVRKRIDPTLRHILAQPPWGRLVKEAGIATDVAAGMFGHPDAIDDRTGTGMGALRLGTGLKYAEQGQLENLYSMKAMIGKLIDKMKSEGKAGSVDIIFKTVIDSMTQADEQQIEVYKGLLQWLAEETRKARGIPKKKTGKTKYSF